ncbi:MAG TPA: hemerythrin domain-containing protein [Bryobacteraceae bacterium]|nr:hemerythrin domain-containing protein [Bryobacteraceae bacterium]
MIRIGQANATIDTPVEHLMACHRRIEDRLATLKRAGEHLGENRTAALEAIKKSIAFLDSSGALHTEDEEASLFPRLRPLLRPEEVQYLDSLEAQHREAESIFSQLKEAVAKLATAPDGGAVLENRYHELAARLSALYRPHIQSEDEILTRMARRDLGTDQLQAISREMRARREK